jgi:DNA gyrase subunit A
MFATRSGNVRRNKLSDFVQINRNGKIAMKLDEGDSIVGVGLCNAEERRPADHRPRPRDPLPGQRGPGVRRPRLHRRARHPPAGRRRGPVDGHPRRRRREPGRTHRLPQVRTRPPARPVRGRGDDAVAPVEDEEDADGEADLTPERIIELGAAEEYILTLSSEGIGKRTSAYDFRRTGRGGQGLLAQDLTRKGGRLVASFPVEQTDEILLVTDAGQLIRCPVANIRIAGRNTQGVIVFRTADDEHVVSVERLEATGGDADATDDDGGDQTPAE